VKKASIYGLFVLIGYVLVAVICQLLPTNKPDFATVLVPGTHFGNKAQGNEQTILSYHDGVVRVLGHVGPYAQGPPEHVHTNFDEPFSVQAGTLSLLVAGQKKTLRAGESFTVPRGTYHKFFNETDSLATGIGDSPAAFTFMLTQLYGLSNEDPAIFNSPRFLLQLSVWGNDFDSYLKAGPPPFVVKIMKFLLLPVAKLAGYRYANPTYFPIPGVGYTHPNRSSNRSFCWRDTGMLTPLVSTR
jgi:mannose-6-phosphate isomerase-like protein (cupin superfamily)